MSIFPTKILLWERLEGKKASRVALYREDVSINEEDATLQRLRDWAVQAMIQFRAVISEYLPPDV